MLERLKTEARRLKAEVLVLYVAARHPGTPRAARLLVLLIVAYVFSPIDLVPDFIPVLGILDDLILVPAGIALALRLVPAPVLAECRRRAADEAVSRSAGRVAAGVIVFLWVGLALYLVALLT